MHLGRAPLLDFDGTLTALDVDWPDLRRRLGVTSIGELWRTGGWAAVTAAEIEAAGRSDPNQALVNHLEDLDAFAVLTANSEAAVRAFLERHPPLAALAVLVVGRETLGGPKAERDVFTRGYRRCVAATATARAGEPVVYVGDADYELAFAASLGARPVDVRLLGMAGLNPSPADR